MLLHIIMDNGYSMEKCHLVIHLCSSRGAATHIACMLMNNDELIQHTFSLSY